MIGLRERDRTDAMSARELDRSSHAVMRIEIPGAATSIPALESPERCDALWAG
jgi:hypothetical protein